ncbi:MAG: MraY family glycosyltransferase [Myxococcota bacterium]
MLTYLGAFLCAAVVAALLTPIAHRVGILIRAVDHPGDPRKIHKVPIPRIGGLAVVGAFFAPLIGLAIYTNRISGAIYQDLRLVGALIVGTTGIVLLGVYDDIRGADAKLKLTVQGLVAVFMWAAGFRIEVLGNPFGAAISIGVLSLPLTMLWIVGVINALNLIDGLDGLATGVALFAVLVLFGVSYIDNALLLCVVLAALGGSLLGFLFFNFNPAKIFLGDSGSMFLGFILSSIAVWTQRKGPTAAALLIPVLALGIPILDTTLSVVRRVGKGKNPFKADREHLHHRLLALGLSHRNAVLTLYTASGVFALGALALLDSDTTRRVIALATVAVAIFILVRRAGVFKVPGVPAIVAGPLDDDSSVRDLSRQTARRIRDLAGLEPAWECLAEMAHELPIAEMELAWVVARDGETSQQVVYRWASSAKSTVDSDELRDLPLEESGARFGVWRVRMDHREASPEARSAIEALRDALVDLGVRQAKRVELDEPLPQGVVRIQVERR